MVMEIGAGCLGGVFGALLGRHTAQTADSVLKTGGAAMLGFVLTAGLAALSGQSGEAIWWYPIGLICGALVGFLSALLVPTGNAPSPPRPNG